MALTDYIIMPGADYQTACDKIRDKTKKAGVIKSGNMAVEIDSLVPSMKIMRKTGTYTPTSENELITIEHNLGALPDIIVIESNKTTNGCLHDVVVYADEIAQDGKCQQAHIYNTNQIVLLDSDNSIFAEDSTDGYISSTTPMKFKIGGPNVKHDITATYTWTAISGLVYRAGYFFLRLAFDGNGNVIVSGGVPEIKKIRFYHDRGYTTYDYTHAEECVFNISALVRPFE
jgi:hypothetical protein